MKADRFDTQPVEALLRRHTAHTKPYVVDFLGAQILVDPEVFNPTYTKVSGFLARNVSVQLGESVLEMFCGSGAVGLSAAQTASKLVGVDISPKAVRCSAENAERMGVSHKSEFRQGSLWRVVDASERFDVILANPPLLPAIPETLLEMAVADSPEMKLTSGFIAGLPRHLADSGHALMAFSNACSVYVGDPMDFIRQKSASAGIRSEIYDEWDVGYEVYRIIKFTKTGGANGKNHSNS